MSTRFLSLAPAVDTAPTTWADAWPDTPPKESVAWDVEMRRHERRVLVALLARGITPERARELAQEAWLRVIEGHRSGRVRELKLPGLVVAQASFLALDERRRTERRALHHAVWEQAGDKGGEVIPLERQVLARDQLRRILDVVERAHPNAQRVFYLLYGEQVGSAAEVADAVGISVQRVRQILCELRQKIRDEVLEGKDD